MEADFQRYYHLDFRDVYRPGGGASRLTWRRVIVLVDALPSESVFKSAVEGRLPVSEISAAIGDVISSLTGEEWGRWTALERQIADAEFKALLMEERDAERARRVQREAARGAAR